MASSNPTDASPTRVVMKFGGSSVSSRTGWDSIAALVEARHSASERVVIVHSALSGVTDRLEDLVGQAVAGSFAVAFTELAQQHASLARDLDVSASVLEAELD